ncbi:MAG: twin transmembrane helix small protein [Alphaproteobacteria bacterium]|nr:twin transmembrane helix small protein [Alphaproteobacteria bacterium]
MSGFLQILLYAVIGVVTLVLGAGIYALFRGGEFGRSWSNKLMRARVLFQFIAVLLVVAIVWLQRSGGA